jgi:four helix bundle protein
MQDYKNLLVWQKAHILVLELYKLTQVLPKEETFGIKSQLRRAAVSIPANLAEGCGKITSKDTANFFQIALGSLHETEYYILLSKDLAYISLADYEFATQLINEVKAMLISLIKKTRNSIV